MSKQQQWTSLFTFSRSEQRGIFILIFLIIGVNATRLFISGEQPLSLEDMSAFNREVNRFAGQLATAGKNQTGQLNTADQWMTKTSFVIELNTADTFDLQRLRGIGPAFARRITQYRTRLGGFYSPEQLLEVWGMDRSRYDGLKKQVTVDPEKIKRMNLNEATFKEMMAHPYMSFELAKAIALAKKRRDGVTSVEDILQLPEMDSVARIRLVPYITVE